MKASGWLQSAVTKSDVLRAVSHILPILVGAECEGHPVFPRRVWSTIKKIAGLHGTHHFGDGISNKVACFIKGGNVLIF